MWFEVRIWAKIGNSNYWKVDQNRIWTRDHKFRRKTEWTKIVFSKSVRHVRMNSYKHLFGPKKEPLRTFLRYFSNMDKYENFWFKIFITVCETTNFIRKWPKNNLKHPSKTIFDEQRFPVNLLFCLKWAFSLKNEEFLFKRPIFRRT